MRVLGIIPARGGSKGVPRKNIRPLCGKPLLAYTIESAIRARLLTRIVLSTDDPEIAEAGRKLGVEVPFLRPTALAQDDTPMFPVVVHALESIETKVDLFDAVCLLQPTNPLRTGEDIDRCILMLQETDADSVISVLPVPDVYNPKWVYWEDEDGSLRLSTGETEPVGRRQDLPRAFHREGSIYVTRTDVIRRHGNLYGRNVRGLELNADEHVNIDTQADWENASAILARRNTQKRDYAKIF